jgi:Fic family protein
MQGDYMHIAHVWQEKELNTKEALDVALDNYRILFAYHSNALENCGVSVHQTREIFENGKVTNYTGDLRALFETQNQKEAYEKISEDVVKQVQVTPEWICRLHEILCHGCYDETRWSQGERPGTYKKHFYGVGLDAGLPPEDVAKEINFLCGEIARVPFFDGTVESAENLLIAAAYFHLNFEYIHPYADGNGRVGRTVLNYFLMTHGLPPTILFEKDKEIYYQCLAVFDKTQKSDGFVAFLQEQTIKTWMQQRQSKTKGTIKVICL